AGDGAGGPVLRRRAGHGRPPVRYLQPDKKTEVAQAPGHRGTGFAGPLVPSPSKRRRRATEGGSRASGAGGCHSVFVFSRLISSSGRISIRRTTRCTPEVVRATLVA